MRICNDCEKEYEDDFVSERTHRCKICANRYKNAKSRNMEYVPLKDLSKEERERKIKHHFKLQARRETKKKEKTLKRVETNPKKTINREQILAIVKKDIDLAFEKANINQEYLKLIDLTKIIEDLFLIIADGTTVDNIKTAEDVFNNIKSDYDHLLEHTDVADTATITEVAMMQKILSELRRPTKMIVTYFRILEPVISKIKQYPILVKEIENSNKKLKGLKNKYLVKASTAVMDIVKENGEYTDIELQEELTPTMKNKKHFDWKVDCFNLYGNPNKTTFVSENGVWADDIIDAKFRIKQFLKDKFPNVTYMEKDIIIEGDTQNA